MDYVLLLYYLPDCRGFYHFLPSPPFVALVFYFKLPVPLLVLFRLNVAYIKLQMFREIHIIHDSRFQIQSMFHY